MKQLLLTTTAATIMLGTTAFAGITTAVPVVDGAGDIQMSIGVLPETCSFSNPVSGTMNYNALTETFETGTPSTLDVFARNVDQIFVDAAPTLDNGATITNFTWGSGASSQSTFNGVSLDQYGTQNAWSTDRTGRFFMSTPYEHSGTMEILPASVETVGAVYSQNTTTALQFEIYCLE